MNQEVTATSRGGPSQSVTARCPTWTAGCLPHWEIFGQQIYLNPKGAPGCGDPQHVARAYLEKSLVETYWTSLGRNDRGSQGAMRQGGGRYDDLLDFACISVPKSKTEVSARVELALEQWRHPVRPANKISCQPRPPILSEVQHRQGRKTAGYGSSRCSTGGQ